MKQSPAPDRFVWSTDMIEPSRRLKHCRDAFASGFIECDVACNDTSSFWARIQYDRFGEIAVGALASSPKRVTTSAEQAKRNPEGYILDIVWGGRYLFQQGRHEVVLEPGDASLMHNCLPGSMTSLDASEIRSIFIPAEIIQRTLGTTQDLAQAVSHAQPEMRLLTGYLKAVQDTPGIIDPGSRRLIGEQIADLVLTSIARARTASPAPFVAPAARGSRAALFRLASLEIANGLSDPLINSQRIAARLGISQRYLQQLFEDRGTTVAEDLLEKRLLACRRELEDPASDRLTIASIAERAGFNNVSYFNRCFRRRFGITPTEARAGGR